MKNTSKLILFALVLLLAAAVLSACGDQSGNGNAPASSVADGGESGVGDRSEGTSGGSDPPCPAEADVAAAVGAPVLSQPYRFGCHYETADAGTSVTIMSISPSRADQVLEEMRSAASPYGAEVAAIDAGERGYAWSSPAQSQGVAVAGDRAYMLDLVTTDIGGDKKPAVIQILKMMIG